MEKNDVYIIGIGASRGGLEAINNLFKNVNLNMGVAFVISIYLDSDIKMNIIEILKYRTSLNVKEAIDGEVIKEDTIYITPENKYLEISDNTFKIYHRNDNELDMIDTLFTSIGREKKEKGIGIVLSGSIKDGIKGIKNIHKEGGLIIAQNEDSAEFIENLQYAATTGVIDYVLSPRNMMEVISNHIKLKSRDEIEFMVDIDSKVKSFKNYNKEIEYFQRNLEFINILYNKININKVNSLEDVKSYYKIFEKIVLNIVTNNEINIEYTDIAIRKLKESNENLKEINEKLKLSNEELYISNRDYKNKLEKIIIEKEKINSLIKILDFSVINLDKNLIIKKFSGGTTKLLGILPSDIGTEFYKINNIFNNKLLIESIKQCIDNLEERSEIVQKNKEIIYKIKIIPDMNKENICLGAIINILDITDIIKDKNLSSKLEKISDKEFIEKKEIKIDTKYIVENNRRLAEIMMENHYEKIPTMRKQYTEKMHKQSVWDKMRTFDFIKLAIDSDEELLFTNYIDWLNIVLVSYNVPVFVIRTSFEIMIETLKNQGELDIRIENLLKKAIEIINTSKIDKYYKSNFGEEDELCSLYLEYLLNNDKDGATEFILDLYKSKTLLLEDIYLKILEPVMYEVGHLWQRNLISVTQEHFCSFVTKSIIENLSQTLQNNRNCERVFLGACVSNELHEMGSRVVSDFFKLNGWNTYYLGANTPELGLIKFIKDLKVDVLGLSASMMNHVEEVKKIIETIRKDKDCNNVKIIVGGYIFNNSKNLWKYVGADGYGRDAKESFKVACSLI